MLQHGWYINFCQKAPDITEVQHGFSVKFALFISNDQSVRQKNEALFKIR